jgi:hypothetical protein
MNRWCRTQSFFVCSSRCQSSRGEGVVVRICDGYMSFKPEGTWMRRTDEGSGHLTGQAQDVN